MTYGSDVDPDAFLHNVYVFSIQYIAYVVFLIVVIPLLLLGVAHGFDSIRRASRWLHSSYKKFRAGGFARSDATTRGGESCSPVPMEPRIPVASRTCYISLAQYERMLETHGPEVMQELMPTASRAYQEFVLAVEDNGGRQYVSEELGDLSLIFKGKLDAVSGC